MLDKVISDEFDLYISEKQFSEIERVLNYPKFKFGEEQKNRFMTLLKTQFSIIKTQSEISLLKDIDDNTLLECAQDISADYIITGDKEVLSLKILGKTKILTAKEFLISKR